MLRYFAVVINMYINSTRDVCQLDEDTWDASQNGDTAEERQAAKEKLRKEVTTHVSIHTLHLDGLRELHRHFLRLPDGAVVEVGGFTKNSIFLFKNFTV